MSELLSVNVERLRSDVEALSRIGRSGDKGLYRLALSDEDMLGRQWLLERLAEAKLEHYIDGAANIHGRLGWDGKTPSVMTGSHLDTVPGGGHLDGALGVIAGLECLRRLSELNLELAHPVESVAFTDEEGRFGGMTGSQAIAGKLERERMMSAVDLDGVKLTDALARRGFDPEQALSAVRPADSIHGFVELHIEQGPFLDRNGVKVGVVEGIVGLFRWRCRLVGIANHAGTTPMDMRNDAFLGSAEFGLAIPRIVREHGGPRTVATIGRVELFPGAANVVPGRAEFSLDVRDLDTTVMANLAAEMRRVLSEIAAERGLTCEVDVMSEISPVRCDPAIVELINGVAKDAGVATLHLPSGAAHDTQTMANIARVGMVFVASADGRSHSPAEWSEWDAIEDGANVLLNTLYRLAKS